MENKNIIIMLIVVIVILAFVAGIMFLQQNTSEPTNVDNNQTEVDEVGESSPDTITVELPEFGKTYTETAGDYSVDAQKWMGTTVGGFEVYLYKNGKSVDKDSYLSRAYSYMDGEWKWSEWDNGEEDHELRHRYPVSRGVEIQKVEVKF